MIMTCTYCFQSKMKMIQTCLTILFDTFDARKHYDLWHSLLELTSLVTFFRLLTLHTQKSSVFARIIFSLLSLDITRESFEPKGA